jgi:outer membrane protein
LLALMVAVFAPRPASAQDDDEPTPPVGPKRIGIVTDGPFREGSGLLPLAQEELRRFVNADKVVFPDDKQLTGDHTMATAQKNLAKLLADPDVDVIWAFGVLASDVALHRPRLDKPVVAPFVIDPQAQGLAKGRVPMNLSHVIWTPSLGRDLKALRELGELDEVAYLVAEPWRIAFPKLQKTAAEQARELGIRLTVISGKDAAAAVRALPKSTDAVYVGFDLQRSKEQRKALVRALVERKLPSFSQLGRREVDEGLLMGLGGPENGKRLARLVAVNTDAILRGETPSRMISAFQQVETLVLNVGTARQIGLSLSWDVLSEAELLGDKRAKAGRQLTLEGIVSEVSARNLDLRANREGLIASEESVREARGAFFPRLESSLSGAWNDPDGASGANPERSLSWGASASQALINEPVLAQFQIQKHLVTATRFDNDSAALDAAQAATVAYVNVLAAKTTEEIQRDNLKVTRTQLALARVRKRLGTGSRSEVVRLESQLASNRSTVISAIANRNIAEIEVNRLLNRPLEEPFELADVSLADTRLMAGGERLQRYMTSPERFRKLRGFMAQEAIRNAPELGSLGARIAAKDRESLSNALAPFVPQISLGGSVSHRFLAGGAGTGAAATAAFPPNNFNWQVGLTASLPLWEGNARYARIDRANAQTRQLEVQRDASKQIIEANLRRTLHQAGASFAAIRLQREAADSAAENLELVQEAYGRGKSNVITLLDAQNQALVGRLNATTAVYQFLTDLLNVQRAMGRFEFSMSNDDMAAFFQRLSSHVQGSQP